MSRNSRDNRTFDIADILARPTIYGLPTFAEYCKLRAKFVRTPNDLFASVDQGGHMLKECNHLRKIKYKYGRYECDNWQALERILDGEGVDYNDLRIRNEVIPEVGLKCTVVVEFMNSAEYQRRQAIDKAEAEARLAK